MSKQSRFDLNTENCLFCGACASIAPNHFLVDGKRRIARVTSQPQTADELAVCRAAMINCPASTIRESTLSTSSDALDSSLA